MIRCEVIERESMVKDQLIEVGKGETLFLVSEAPGFEFEVKCEEADRLSVA